MEVLPESLKASDYSNLFKKWIAEFLSIFDL